jgi:hypothetical protein
MTTNGVSRPVLRKLLATALACLVTTLALLAMVSADLPERLLYAVFAATIAIRLVLQFRKERLILLNPAGSLGSVRERSRLGHKRGVRIRYSFTAADGKGYTGIVMGGPFLPQQGQPIDILYRCDDPAYNLPRRRFWLHELQGTPS